MEIKINKEIREYTESMFFGLSMRQFFFSAIACGSAVAVYFLLRPILGMEVTSWACIIVAVPFAVLGFAKYNGMPAEKFIWAWIKSELLIPKRLTFYNTNVYYHMLDIEDKEKKLRKGVKRKNVKNVKHSA